MTDIRRAFAQRLKAIRISVGFTQHAMASALGIGAARYNKYEIGRSEPPYEVLIKMAKLGGVSIDYLVCGEQQAPPLDAGDQLIELIQIIPLPALIYDQQNRLVSHNSMYQQTFFAKAPHVIQRGIRQELLLRAWAYTQGHDPQVTEQFVRRRLDLDREATRTRPVLIPIGSQRVQIAESRYADYKLVLLTLVDTSPP